MRANFEEKTYENYFNGELASLSQIYFPWGQVQEGTLGFDSSAFSRHRGFWRRLGYPFWFFPPFEGIDLREIAQEMEHYLGIEIDHAPQMTANLLFQYKRPEYIRIPHGAEWKHWDAPYYRYDIDREQQELLMKIHSRFESRVLALYAAPAIHDVNKLVEAYLARKVISRSNFTKVFSLAAHARNTYDRAGIFSIACSEPEKIDRFDLLQALEQKLDNEDTKTGGNNREFIVNFRKQLTATVDQNQYHAESFRSLNDLVAKVERFPLFYSLLVLRNFRQLTGMQWLVKLEQ